MEHLLLGIATIILSLIFAWKAILCTVKKEGGIAKNLLFMAVFGIYGRLFIELYQTPSQAGNIKTLIIALAVICIIVLTVVTIIRKMRNK
jgi:hypothetical protein